MKKCVVPVLALVLSGCGVGSEYYRGKPVEYWVAQLRQGNEADRYQASIALGKIGEPAIPELRTVLKDTNPAIRLAAVSALAKMYDQCKDAFPDLIALLRDPEEKIRATAARAIGRLEWEAGEAVTDLLPLLESQDPECRYEAAKALCLIGADAESAGPALSKFLRDPDLKTRQEIARLIWKTQSQEVIPDLIAALKDEDQKVGMYAGFSLRKLDKQIAAQHGYW